MEPGDDLWIIGDFAYGTLAKAPRYLHQIFNQLPGARQHLIVGNHDGNLTQSLEWASVSPLAEVADGPNKQPNIRHRSKFVPIFNKSTAKRLPSRHSSISADRLLQKHCASMHFQPSVLFRLLVVEIYYFKFSDMVL